MAYTDILFLFLFLPISLLLYYICKERLRKYVLLALSIVFYACGSFAHLALVLVSVGINILLGHGRAAGTGGAEKGNPGNRGAV